MFRNFLKISIRNLIRNKTYSFINVLGLSVSIAFALILLVTIDFELSFDDYHEKKDRIYRITQHMQRSDGIQENAGVQYPMARALRNDFPELEEVALVHFSGPGMVVVPRENEMNDRYKSDEEIIAFVEPSLFGIFDFDFLHGSPENSLGQKNRVVLTRSLASKYFNLPENDLRESIGKELLLYNELRVQVDAIIEDLPANSDFPFNIMVSLESLDGWRSYYDPGNWRSSSIEVNCYFVAPDDFNRKNFEDRLVPFIDKYRGEGASELRRFRIQPLSEIHSDTRFDNYNYRTVSIEKLWVMAAIAMILIFTSAINFINLATAQSFKRIREVGIRKVMGSLRIHLILQFLSEHLIITLLAIGLALVFAELLIVNFADLIYLGSGFTLFENTQVLIYLIILGLMVGLISGIYPSLMLSGFSPLRALHGNILSGSYRGAGLRKTLIVIQFVITQVLIISTVIIQSQLDFLANRPLGFESETHIAFPLPDNDPQKIDLLAAKLRSLAIVNEVTFALGQPQTVSYYETHVGLRDGSQSMRYRTEVKPADKMYFEVFGLKFLAGKNFTDAPAAKSIVVNRAMSEMQGYADPRECVGKSLSIFGDRYTISGVVEDFHSRPLHHEIMPLVFAPLTDIYYEGIARINASAMTSLTLDEINDQIAQIWNEVFSNDLYTGRLVDDVIADRYDEENRISKIFKGFTLVAIIIGSIGLYGLIAFIAAQRVKEIGIRKVLGASMRKIVLLFTNDFMRLLLVAFMISAPIGFYMLDQWLQDFAYQITIDWHHFMLAILISAGITLGAIIYRSITAALANPVDSLRSE